MSLCSSITCSYVSEAASVAMWYCIGVFCPRPMFYVPDSLRSCDLAIDHHASGVGNVFDGACCWWLMDGSVSP